MKDIKDYLHLYLGCEVEHDKGIYRGTLIGIDGSCIKIHCDFFSRTTKGHCVPNGKDFGYFDILQERMKPILRPLSDMTEEEKKEVGFDAYQMLRTEHGDRVFPSKDRGFIWAAKQTAYLLKQGFDLFGLIDSGLAIDKTKIAQSA